METITNRQEKIRFSNKWRKTTVEIITVLYILLFVYAASSKLMDYDNSELQMSKSPIISEYAAFLVWFVPTIEIIIGIFLSIHKTVLIGLYSALVLMVLFTIYIYSILNFGGDVPCQCGGVLQRLDWHQHMIFNIGFIFLAIIGILLKSKIDNKKAN